MLCEGSKVRAEGRGIGVRMAAAIRIERCRPNRKVDRDVYWRRGARSEARTNTDDGSATLDYDR